MEFVPYNAFQKIMRLWDEVHPYNAAQIMRLEGAADYERINAHWRKTLSTLGIGRVVMDGAQYAHTSWNGEAGHRFIRVARPYLAPREGEAPAEAQRTDGLGTGRLVGANETACPQAHSAENSDQENALRGLEAYLTTEMNRRFEGREYCPFRPFVWQEPGANEHYVGVIYHHWPADSGSIKTLLREWYCSMYCPQAARTEPLEIAREGYWHHFGPHRGAWELKDAILSLLRYRTRFSRARISPISDADDFTVRVRIYPQPDGLADQILATARRIGVTVNDIFLAAMAETCHRLGGNPLTAERDELALGTIVDLRMLAQQNMDHLFGMFLGFTNTIVRRQDLEDWPRLLKRISAQTSHQKRSGASQACVLRMIGGLAEAHFKTARQWVDSYRRNMPMAAGISNINMNRHWTARYCPSPLIEYIRVAPPSALLPMTFGTTTTGRKMNLVFTHQIALFNDEHAQRIVDSFVHRINHLE
jgi:NRPS condensation-like uncharacterized protein